MAKLKNTYQISSWGKVVHRRSSWNKQHTEIVHKGKQPHKCSNVEQSHWNKIFSRTYYLAMMLAVSTSTTSMNIDKILGTSGEALIISLTRSDEPWSKFCCKFESWLLFTVTIIRWLIHGLLNRWTDIFFLPRTSWGLAFNPNNAAQTHSIFVKL